MKNLNKIEQANPELAKGFILWASVETLQETLSARTGKKENGK